MAYREPIKNGVTEDTVLLVSFETHNTYEEYRIFNGIFQDYDCRDGGSVSNVNVGYGVLVPCVSSLRMRAQAEGARPEKGFYGYEATYRDVWEVDLDNAKSMLGTLDKLDKAMAKAVQRDGHVQSLGQYALRVCKALGVKRMLREQPLEQRWNSNRYYVMDLATGQAWIDSQVYTWQREKREALEAKQKQDAAIKELALAVS
jgi:hypothetical protein